MAYACKICGSVLDAASGFGVPQKDDISICLYCGNIAIFNADFTFRPPTDDERVEIESDFDVKKFLEVQRIVSRKKGN